MTCNPLALATDVTIALACVFIKVKEWGYSLFVCLRGKSKYYSFIV